MVIKKPVVISTLKKKSETSDFTFSKDQIRRTGNQIIDAYRDNAWQIFQDTGFPTTREEAWRRTDIRGLKLNQYHLLETDQKFDLSDIPENLLEPVADGDHGGQIVLYGTNSQVRLDQELKSKGVVFCDLLTAEHVYSELLSKAIGKIVKPEEGKF